MTEEDLLARAEDILGALNAGIAHKPRKVQVLPSCKQGQRASLKTQKKKKKKKRMHKTPQPSTTTTTAAATATASITQSHTLSHITKALASADSKEIPTKERDDRADNERERTEEKVGQGEGKGEEESDAKVEKRGCLVTGVEMDRGADEG